MTLFLQRPELELLAKLCGLFSSHHDGERASAAAKADAIVRSLGLTWRDIVLDKNTPRARAANSIKAQIAETLAHISALNAWEKKFIRLVDGKVTAKQRAKVDQVYRKVRAYYGRGAR
jgi:hypothetical protein